MANLRMLLGWWWSRRQIYAAGQVKSTT